MVDIRHAWVGCRKKNGWIPLEIRRTGHT